MSLLIKHAKRKGGGGGVNLYRKHPTCHNLICNQKSHDSATGPLIEDHLVTEHSAKVTSCHRNTCREVDSIYNVHPTTFFVMNFFTFALFLFLPLSHFNMPGFPHQYCGYCMVMFTQVLPPLPLVFSFEVLFARAQLSLIFIYVSLSRSTFTGNLYNAQPFCTL